MNEEKPAGNRNELLTRLRRMFEADYIPGIPPPVPVAQSGASDVIEVWSLAVHFDCRDTENPILKTSFESREGLGLDSKLEGSHANKFAGGFWSLAIQCHMQSN